jgi:hypothetical protein
MATCAGVEVTKSQLVHIRAEKSGRLLSCVTPRLSAKEGMHLRISNRRSTAFRPRSMMGELRSNQQKNVGMGLNLFYLDELG